MAIHHGGAAWPEFYAGDRNQPYADSSFSLDTYDSPSGPRTILTVVDTEPRDSDDTPEGFVEVTVPPSALVALRDALNHLIENVPSGDSE